MRSDRQVNYLDDLDIVMVETCGKYILGQEKETLQKALEVAQANNCWKLLFDHRKATVEVRTMDGYNRPSVYADMGFDRFTKLATLVTEVDEGLKFYETVCVNRGWAMHVFDNFDAALVWLKGE